MHGDKSAIKMKSGRKDLREIDECAGPKSTTAEVVAAKERVW